MQLAATNNPLAIDFLPDRYREESTQRRVNLWRLAVVGMFVWLVVVGTLVQRQTRAKTAKRLAAVNRNYEFAQRRSANLGRLLVEQREAIAQAQLVNYLRHRWPRTQVLAVVLRPLPDAITLHELHLANEFTTAQGPRADTTLGERNDEATDPPELAKRDLRQLRQQVGAKAVVTLEGTTSDAARLHDYLAAVAANPLVFQAELQNIEAGQGDHWSVARFRARIEMRPGYGEPGGPTAGQLRNTLTRSLFPRQQTFDLSRR